MGFGFTVEIVTDTEQFNAANNISGDSPPMMPEVEFASRVVANNGDTDPDGITFQWTMELSYEEGNYEDIADSVLTLTETVDGDTSWQPDFSQLPGDTPVGGHIKVTVNASQGQGQPSLSDTDVRDGYMIRGENPSSDTIVDAVPGSANDPAERRRGRLAMVWKESTLQWRPEQFSGCEYDQSSGTWDCSSADPDNPNFPLIAPDNGWGLTQLTDPLPTRIQVWDWVENLTAGLEHFDENYSNTKNTVEGWHSYWGTHSDPIIRDRTSWEWDPEEIDSNYEMRTDAEIELIKNLFESDAFDVQRQDDDWGNEEFYVRDAADATDPPWSVHTPENSTREENHFDGQQVSKILNMQAYLQFNAGSGSAGFPAIVDEFGIIRRRIADDTWDNLTGYINRYDGEPWNS